MLGNNWTWTDYDFLYKNYANLGAEEVAKRLNKPVDTVITKSEKMHLRDKHSYTKEEIKLSRAYGSILKGSMIFLIPDRTSKDIKELLACAKKQSTLV